MNERMDSCCDRPRQISSSEERNASSRPARVAHASLQLALPAMPDVLLAVTLFGSGGSPQLCGPAMVKTTPAHQLRRIIGCFCRWAGVQPESVVFHSVDGRALTPEATVAELSLSSGHAITAVLAPSAPLPSSSAQAVPLRESASAGRRTL